MLPEDLQAEVEEDKLYQAMLDHGMEPCVECGVLRDPSELVGGRCPGCRCQMCGAKLVLQSSVRFTCSEAEECGAVYDYNFRTRTYEFIGYTEDIMPLFSPGG